MRKALTILFIITLLILTACGNQGKQSGNNFTSINDGSKGDLRVETENKETLPYFLDDHHENMQILYNTVAQHKELLQHNPCFRSCGVYVSTEHNSACCIN